MASSASVFLSILKWCKHGFHYCGILLKVSPSFPEDRFTPGWQTKSVLYKQVCSYSIDQFPYGASSPTDCNGITCLMVLGQKVLALDEHWILISCCDQCLLSESFSVCGLGKTSLLWLLCFMDLRDRFFNRAKNLHCQGLHTHSWNLTFKKV